MRKEVKILGAIALAVVIAAIVGAKNEDHVFEGDDQKQRPDQHGDDADHVGGQYLAALRGVDKRFAQRIERAGSDVAINDAHRGEGERNEAGAAAMSA